MISGYSSKPQTKIYALSVYQKRNLLLRYMAVMAHHHNNLSEEVPWYRMMITGSGNFVNSSVRFGDPRSTWW
jgi:hypothetical protein